MREETVTHKIYKFNELSEEVQQKVLDNNRDWNVGYQDWYEFVYEAWTEKLEQAGFEDSKIHFRGFWSQGDGASFDARVNTEKVIQYLIDSGYTRYKKLLKVVDYINISIEKNSYATHYCHDSTRYISLDLSNYRPCPRLEKLVNELEEDVEHLRSNWSRDIYQSLEEEYEGLTSDEYIRESMEINELEFLENGEIYY